MTRVSGGTFSQTMRKSFADHITVVQVQESQPLNMYYVTITFDTDKNKQYVFDIPGEKYKPTKEAIAKEVLRQLKAE